MSKEGIQKRSVLRRRSHGQPQNISFRFLAPSCMKEKQPERNLLCIGSKKFDNIHFFPANQMKRKWSVLCTSRGEGGWIDLISKYRISVRMQMIHSRSTSRPAFLLFLNDADSMVCNISASVLPHLSSTAYSGCKWCCCVTNNFIQTFQWRSTPDRQHNNTRIVLRVLECLWPALVLFKSFPPGIPGKCHNRRPGQAAD